MQVTFTHLTGPRKGQTDGFDSDAITIGRASDNRLAFGDEQRRVSAHHAEIRRKEDHFVLRDLGSTNGTMINGRRVVISEIKADDMIEFGAGGPLVRFGVVDEVSQANGPESVDTSLRQTRRADHFVGQSTVEMMVDRAVRSRPANLRFIIAMAAAMLIGGGGGIILSSRLNPSNSSWAIVASRNSAAVVLIRAEYELVDSTGQVSMSDARTGSGFVISSDGLIVTNRHLLRPWEYSSPSQGLNARTTKIEVIFPGQQRQQAVPAQIMRLAASKETDVAILKISPQTELPVVQGLDTELADTSQGDEVAVMGYPLGMNLLQITNDDRIEPSLSTGVVSRVSQEEVIQLHLSAYQGNSGGPVLNRRGEVIGILTSNVGNAQDIAFCLPISAAFELVKGELPRES